jgi:hypothetical protein
MSMPTPDDPNLTQPLPPPTDAPTVSARRVPPAPDPPAVPRVSNTDMSGGATEPGTGPRSSGADTRTLVQPTTAMPVGQATHSPARQSPAMNSSANSAAGGWALCIRPGTAPSIGLWR